MRRRKFDAACLTHLARQMMPPPAVPRAADAHPQAQLLRYSHPAMATVFELIVPWQDDVSRWATSVFDLIDELESQLTVYRDDSEVSQINQRAFDEPVEVECKLFDLLQTCRKLTDETQGAFDITAGPLIRAWGFWRRQGRMPTPVERQQAWERVGMRQVVLDPVRRSVRFQRPGMELNFGSIGKGYAVDRCFERLYGAGIGSALMHAGGSSVRAMGHQPGSRGWPVGIRHPWEPDRRIAVVSLRNRALATSAATYQYFEYNRKKLGHLLDPRTGWPADGVASATAIAPTGAEADALATAFYVLGVEKSQRYCDLHPEVGAIILPEGSDRPVVFNLTESDVRIVPRD